MSKKRSFSINHFGLGSGEKEKDIKQIAQGIAYPGRVVNAGVFDEAEAKDIIFRPNGKYTLHLDV